MIPSLRKQTISTAVIPAAGLGTRMEVISGSNPKELLPVCGNPLIHYTVQEAVNAGVKKLLVIISPEKPALKKYFNSKKELIISNKNIPVCDLHNYGIETEFITQEQPYGLAHAIAITEQDVGGCDFLLLLPDNFFPEMPSPSTQLIQSYSPGRCCIGILELTPEIKPFFTKTGKIEFERTKEHNKVTITFLGNKDKHKNITPDDSTMNYRTVGRSIYSGDFFTAYKEIAHSGGSEADDLPVHKFLIRLLKLDGCILSGRGFDAGNSAGYKAAQAWAETINHKIP